MNTQADVARRDVGQRIKQARTASGMSITRFAAVLNVTRPTIYALEAGERRIFPDELLVIAKLFNVSLEWLLNDYPDLPKPRLSKIEALIAYELSKLLPKTFDRVVKLVPSMRSQHRVGETKIRRYSSSEATLSALRNIRLSETDDP